MPRTFGFKTKNLEPRLAALAAFLPRFEGEGFKFSEMRGGNEIEPGVIQMTWCDFSDAASEFIDRCYADGWVLRDFDWSKWAATRDAVALINESGDPSAGPALAGADPEQLAKVLTTAIRADRFCDGYLQHAFEAGLICAILRRARDLAASA